MAGRAGRDVPLAFYAAGTTAAIGYPISSG